MTTTTRERAWWQTAPNPACRSWCTTEHQPGEFSDGGALTCSVEVATTDWYAVEVTQLTSVPAGDLPPAGRVEVLEPAVWAVCTRDMIECTPAEVIEYAVALVRAATICEQVAR